jgi:acyl-CoA synthetase (AMP-forming)/AMP-acid ligase II
MLERFLALAAAAPDAPALIADDATITRAELLGAARAMTARFAAGGLREGDLVGVQLPNSADFVAAFVAALERKLVMVPIDRDATETEVGAILSHFAIKGLLYRRDRAAELTTRVLAGRPAVPAEARLIKTTSGSTGAPKGIVASAANLLADCVNICGTMDIHPSDVNFGAIPFSHSYGFSNLVTPLLAQGTAVVISNDYLPQSILALCNQHRCTVVPLIPMVFEHLAAAADGHFDTVRTFLSAGAPLPPATSRRFRERFGREIHSFYGCSECGGIAYDRRGGAAERGTVGSAMEGVSLSLSGERLVVRSDAVTLGYLHDAATFVPFDTFTTDDLAQLDADGEIALTGRASELINTAGKKVNPREVEQVILQLDGVRQAKVYGSPAGARGEVVAAAVVASPDVTRDEVREFCRARLSPHKVPRIVKLIDAIPVDDRGKVRRAALAEL